MDINVDQLKKDAELLEDVYASTVAGVAAFETDFAAKAANDDPCKAFAAGMLSQVIFMKGNPQIETAALLDACEAAIHRLADELGWGKAVTTGE